MNNDTIINLNIYMNNISSISSTNHNIGSRGNEGKIKQYSLYKSKETLRINGNKNKKVILNNFKDGDLYITFTKRNEKDRMKSNVFNYTIHNHKDLNDITNKDCKDIYSYMLLISKYYRINLEYMYINIDFSENGDIHYHSIIRFDKLNDKIINNNKITNNFIKYINNTFSLIDMYCYIEYIYDINGLSIYTTNKMINSNKLNDRLNKVFSRIPNFLKMQYEFGNKLKDIRIKIKLSEFLDIIKKNKIENIFYKVYYYCNQYGEILNKITKGLYKISKDKSLDLFKDYLS